MSAFFGTSSLGLLFVRIKLFTSLRITSIVYQYPKKFFFKLWKIAFQRFYCMYNENYSYYNKIKNDVCLTKRTCRFQVTTIIVLLKFIH